MAEQHVAKTDPFPPDDRVVYKTVGDVRLRLDVFRPAARGGAASAIVFFHGGGWRGGAPGQFHPQCRHLARRGMVAMSAEYRLMVVHGTSPRECVQDGKSAVRWIRRNAGRLGIDPARLAAGGGSAGAHVAAACATLPGFDAGGEDAAVSARPDALVLFNPVFDNGPAGWGHETVKAYWQDISPLHHVGADLPPTLVLLGEEDRLVPVATALEFQHRASAAGARCDLRTYPGQPHGFFNYGDGRNPHYAATVHAMDRFLASIGYLAGEPGLSPPDVASVDHPPRCHPWPTEEPQP